MTCGWLLLPAPGPALNHFPHPTPNDGHVTRDTDHGERRHRHMVWLATDGPLGINTRAQHSMNDRHDRLVAKR
jgi:hypothetical protein